MTRPPLRRPRLLLVADRSAEHDALAAIFAADHELFFATAADALAFCRAGPLPDLILLVAEDSGPGGDAVCRQLKADASTAEIPLLLLGARQDAADQTAALAAGAADFVGLPATPAVIRARVRTHLLLKAQQVRLADLIARRAPLAKGAAAATSRVHSAFLETMSHELRAVLNGIIGFTGLAAGLAGDVKLRNYLGRIDACTEKLGALIDDQHSVARRVGDLRLKRREFRLGELLARVERQMRPLATAKGLMLHIEAPQQPLDAPLHGDAQRIEQVLGELLGNAIKFTAAGEIAMRLQTLRPSDEHLELRFAVRDHGPGIPVADQRRIFLPGERLAGAPPAPGLGLTTSKHLALRMGGTLNVHSVPGAGSTFTFTALVGIPA